ncbi:hypothetical protein ACWEPA_25010 [Streptomyces filamentosus]
MPDTQQQPAGRTPARGTAQRARTVYDPTGTLDTRLPLDRAPHEHLAAKVLSWKHGGGTPPPQADIDQAALTLAGYARLLIDELHRTTAALLPTAPARQRARALCANAATLLATPALSPTGTLDPALARAQLVADLHTELDSLHPADPSGPHPAGDETP